MLNSITGVCDGQLHKIGMRNRLEGAGERMGFGLAGRRSVRRGPLYIQIGKKITAEIFSV